MAACGFILSGGGCISGSLATQTGAAVGETWSTAPRQQAHVGEIVPLSFVLKKPLEDASIDALGVADYCVFDINGDMHDADLTDGGAFETECSLEFARAGDSVRIVATAFRQSDARDHMRINGEWLTNESPQNEPDESVASATVTLDIYQSSVELLVPPSPDGLDEGTARLLLRRRDIGDAVIYAHRPPRDGFTIEPAAGGGWRIAYLPAADEVNPTGTTVAEFSFYDHAGNRHEYRTELPTP